MDDSVEAGRRCGESLVRRVGRLEILHLVAAFVPVDVESDGRIPVGLPNSGPFMSAQLLQGQARRHVVGKPHLVHAPSDRKPLRAVGDGFGLQVE